MSSTHIPISLELGAKRVFASALEWPGWTRSGRDEEAALQSLLAYGPRYQPVIQSAKLPFRIPKDPAEFTVVERLRGGAGTDFGAPGVAPAADSDPVDARTLRRLIAILDASWDTLATTIQAATGHKLRTGPRGGGRELDAITRHILDSHQSYLRHIGWAGKLDTGTDLQAALAALRAVTPEALTAATAPDAPKVGPRGGKRWSPRFFVRYSVWHLLDHVWEIEDRML